jgi:hypothetical protein
MPKWTRQLWDDIRPNLIWLAFTSLFGSSMLVGLIVSIRALGNSPINLTTAAIIFGVGFVGLMVLLSIDKRRKGRSIMPSETLMRGIVWIPIFIGLALCVWGYFIGTLALRMNTDVRHLRTQMVRYVLPRQLAQEQIDSIGEYLSHKESHEVIFNVIKNDSEASLFRSDIQRALEKGGWAVTDTKYIDDAQEGVIISSQEPSPPPPQSAADRLNPKQSLRDILAQAFRRAGVPINGVGGGTGPAITTATITISIGSRKRDKFAVTPPNFGDAFRPGPLELTDDDFK